MVDQTLQQTLELMGSTNAGGQMTGLILNNNSRPSVLIERGVTRREGDVFAAVAQHLTNSEIAGSLGLSERTVESHVSSLLRKLDATNRRELAELWRQVDTAQRARRECPRVGPVTVGVWRVLHADITGR